MGLSVYKVEYKNLENNILACGLDSLKVCDLIEKVFSKPSTTSVHYIDEGSIDKAEKEEVFLSEKGKKVLEALRREIEAYGEFDLVMC